MKNIFSPDSPFMRWLGKFADLIILNVLYLVSCIPIVTIGAANAALYDVAIRLSKDEAYVWKHYWRAFGSNFKKATLIWMILLIIGGALYCCAMAYKGNDLPNRGLSLILLGIASITWLSVYSWVFPLQARYENSVVQTLRTALICSFSFLPRTILIVFLNAIFPFIATYFGAVVLFGIFVLLLIWFSGIAYISTLLLRKHFKQLEEMADA